MATHSNENVTMLEFDKMVLAKKQSLDSKVPICLVSPSIAHSSKLCHFKIKAIQISRYGFKPYGFELGLSLPQEPGSFDGDQAIFLSVGEHFEIKKLARSLYKALTLFSVNTPRGRSLEDLVYEVEVNTASRTLRFLLDKRQVHDKDIPIKEQSLNGMSFFVKLYNCGDCLRIID